MYQHPSRKLIAICCSCALLVFLYLSYSRHPESATSRTSQPTQEQRKTTESHNLLDDASNATLGFQKVLVINLPSRSDRRDLTSLAAASTDIEVEYVDGVTEVDEKAWPPGTRETNLNRGSLANWRSHLNALRIVVEQNISSALIVEDDADWDIRIKTQMHDFAQASRLLLQPLPGTKDKFLDPTWPQPDARHEDVMNFEINKASTGEPTTSPYGDLDRWHILWLGHCGCRFPRADDKNMPIGRAVIPNDTTVPALFHINKEFGDIDQLIDQYPEYTRVVSRAHTNTCALAYAVSQAGARQILYQLGVNKIDGTFDMMLGSLCHGDSGRDLLTCLSPQPALFNHHRPVGSRSSWSNINEHEGYNDVPMSTNIRWSTRVNLQKLIKGETDYVDSYPDE